MFEQMRQRLIEKAIRGQLVPQSDSEPEVEQIGEVSEDVPFEIPTKWKWVQLKNVGQVVGGGTPKTHVIEFWGGTISWITPADLGKNKNKFISFGSKSITEDGLNNSSAKLMPKGSVVYSSRAPIGHIAISDNEVCTNQGCKSLVPNFDLTSSDWAYYALIARTDDIKSRASGTTFKEISAKGMGETWLPLPSIEEQKRIITELETLLAEIDKAEKAYNDLTGPLVEQYKALILDKAMRGQLVPQLDSEPYVAQVGETPKGVPFAVPDKWKWSRFKDCMTIERGGSPRPINEYLTADADGINWIKIGDATRGSKYIESCKEKIKPSGLKKTRFIPKGSLILTNSMSFGYPYILGVDGCIHDGWLALSRFEKHLDKEFLYYYLLSPLCRKQFVETASGAVVKNLNTKKVLDLYIPVPPLVEQQRIVVQLELLLNQVNKLSI